MIRGRPRSSSPAAPRPMELDATDPHTFDVRPDTADFRDQLYVPTLVEVLPEIRPARYRRYEIPVLDQGEEGACTGFALATVAHYLLHRRQGEKAMPLADEDRVSCHMFYELAKRYDEWEGEAYEGSSARGAMKAWHKHGVCRLDKWPSPADTDAYDRRLTAERALDALDRPLGAYYRVNHKDLVALHSAITEVGVLYATAHVHTGWQEPGSDGRIAFTDRTRMLGGHAFVIVGYDASGLWVQNSWGEGWGDDGLGHVSYDDWLRNGFDVWVARLGAPVAYQDATTTAISFSAKAQKSDVYAFQSLRPHIVSIGNEGRFRTSGTFGTDLEDVRDIVEADLAETVAPWSSKRVMLYAHGGLVPEKAAVQRVADYRETLLQRQVYPLAFVWKTDYWSTLRNVLDDALRRRRAEGFLDDARDFMLDRLDDALEPLARVLTGKQSWDEMKENALRSTRTAQGGAAQTLDLLAPVLEADGAELHLVAHSAGSIFFAPLMEALAERGLPVASCTLWAPACTLALFQECYQPAIESGAIERFTLFTLTEEAEQADHCARIYNKSLLYLVSNAFEDRFRIPLIRPTGEPILGLAESLEAALEDDNGLRALFDRKTVDWVQSPNGSPKGSPLAARATRHGDFDDDEFTLQATLSRILGQRSTTTEFSFRSSSSGLRDRREALNRSVGAR